MSNKSPLRYPGGKTRACKVLDEIISVNYDIEKYDCLISPFFGGGSFEFYFQNKYGKHIYANDKFTPLYNFWTQAQNNKDNVCTTLRQLINIDKKQFQEYQNKVIECEPFQQALYFFIINRCSFNGSTLSGGFSLEASKMRFTPSSINNIEKLNLSNIDFSNEDFSTFLEKHKDKNALIFLDPPYYIENSKLYGSKGNLHESFQHSELFVQLKNYSDWILTYNNCDFIRELYKDYTILDVNWSYGMNKTKKSSEIVILSKKLA